jgi:hypothetical protein
MGKEEDSEAIELFLRAMDEEGKGNIGEAIKLYSQSYRLNSDIDKDPQVLERLKQIQIEKSLAEADRSEPQKNLIYVDAELEGEIMNKTPLLLTNQASESDLFRCIPLWCRVFEHLKSFPTSYECLASSSSFLYLLSRLYTKRLSYIKSLRMRFDGIFIAKFTYFREGESLLSYAHPLHLVTYYRYFRFFEDGTILAMVTPSEPKRVLELMRNYEDILMEKSELAKHDDRANLFKGYWKFSRYTHSEQGDEAHFTIIIQNITGRGLEFIIAGKLYNYPREILHRSNVIKLDTYIGYSPMKPKKTSTDREEMIRFDVSQWPRFRFSRVKSYHQQEIQE